MDRAYTHDMADLSKKLLRDGVERIIAKGAKRIASEEANIGAVLANLAKSAKSTTASAEETLEEAKHHAKNFGETVLDIAKSVDSFSDLEQRFKAHRGEFVDAARSFSQQIYAAFTHLSEPVHDDDTQDPTISGELGASTRDEGATDHEGSSSPEDRAR